jgi:hypothetical protein
MWDLEKTIAPYDEWLNFVNFHFLFEALGGPNQSTCSEVFDYSLQRDSRSWKYIDYGKGTDNSRNP